MLVDQVIFKVKGGQGGEGAVSFRREKYLPRGGPDGGTGGRGGRVIISATARKKSFYHLSQTRWYRAASGQAGRGRKQAGAQGRDLIIEVPLGTQVFDHRRGKLLADLITEGMQVVVANGGEGGKGNVGFVTPTNRAPRVSQKGQPGEFREVRLELKLLADVGLVGYPNSGKSAFLQAVSDARPQVADYPFSTLDPQLGVAYQGTQSFTLVEIPGIIKGSSQGGGLGLGFLKHLERVELILYLVDLSPWALVSPEEAFSTVQAEVKSYSSSLWEKATIVVGTKLDIPEARQAFVPFRETLEKEGFTVVGISSVTGEGVPELLKLIASKVSRREEKDQPEPGRREVVIFSSENKDSYPEYQFRSAYLEKLVTKCYQEEEADLLLNTQLNKSGFKRYFARIKPHSVLEVGGIRLIWDGKDLKFAKDDE